VSALVPGKPGVHFTGLGGDELFGYLPALTWSLWREQHARSWSTISRFRRLHRWSLVPTVSALLSRASPAQELKRAIPKLRLSAAEGPADSLSWNPRPAIAPWISRSAEDLIVRTLRATAHDQLTPLNDDRSRHQMLESIQFQGRTLSQISRTFPHVATAWRAPFLERAIVESAMSVKTSERFGAGIAKPLLAAATARFMPADFFKRQGKGEYSLDIHTEFARARYELMDYFRDSKLARMGFLDVDILNSHIDSPAATGDSIGRIENLVAVERWLKSATPEKRRPSDRNSLQ